MTLELTGIHHLTAVTAQASKNLAFYTTTLGMRLVKRTVNQDDTSAYHLFYGDGLATPGSDLTFFDWPAAPEHRGTHSVVRTALRVSGDGTLSWWHSRLTEAGLTVGDIVERDGRMSIAFEDFEGQRLLLVDDKGVGDSHPWPQSPVPAQYQIRGLGHITMSVPRLERTTRFLTEQLNMRKVREYAYPERPEHTVHVFEMGRGGAAAELHVADEPDMPQAHLGAGGVHHVAFRVPDQATLHQWTDRLTSAGVRSSGEVERYYFRSLYFREPNGVLFELATDGPGFAVDEPMESLGEHLALPPFLEGQRASIEAGLKPL